MRLVLGTTLPVGKPNPNGKDGEEEEEEEDEEGEE